MKKQQKVSLICPIYNEADSVEQLIESMLNQSRKPDEIIFVDSFSKDGTAEIIKKYESERVRLIQRKSNIAEARNIAVKNAKHDIIAGTDASSRLDKDWLKNITKPFKDKSVDVVSGGYIAISKGGLEDYLSMITVKPMEEWDENTFLPSGRSIAFRKKAWKAVGGYPEDLYTGEDTLFDLELKERGFKFRLARNAVVYWRGRSTLRKFIKQFYLYGKGDGKSKNIFKMKANLLFFIGLNLWIIATVGSLFINPWISLWLAVIMCVYFLLEGSRIALRRKRVGAFFVLPDLLFLKRFSYFFGVWRGLL